MPKSATLSVKEPTKITPSNDAPTRFDFYDLQRSMDVLAQAVNDNASKKDDLETELTSLSDKIDALSTAVADLTDALKNMAEKA